MAGHRTATLSSLIYLVRSALVGPDDRRVALAGPHAKPWCELLERLTRRLRADLKPVVLPLLSTIIEKAGDLTSHQRELVNTAARRLLTLARAPASRDIGTIRVSIRGVCRTFGAAPLESAAALREMISHNQLRAFGFEEFPTLAWDLGYVIRTDPAFVAEVYRSAMSFEETDRSATPLGGSALLSLQSDRTQEYESGMHALGELLQRFMSTAPVEATGVVIAAVEAHVSARATRPLDALPTDVIRLGSSEGRFIPDHSFIWDAGDAHSGEIHRLALDAFESGLVEVAERGDDSVLTAMLDQVIGGNRFAAVWRRVLIAGTRAPRSLGLRLWRLATCVPLLVADDTTEHAGRFLRAAFPLLEAHQRAAVERAILSIPESRGEARELYEERRDRLLGCLPAEHVATSEARDRLSELAAAGGPPPNDPLFSQDEVGMDWISPGELLRGQGVDFEAEPNQRLQTLFGAVGAFAEHFWNEPPTRAEAEGVLPAMRELRLLLERNGEGADHRLLPTARENLTRVCATFAGTDWLPTDGWLLAAVRDVLLESAKDELPRPTSEQAYEEHGFVSTGPRWYAALGIVSLARDPAQADNALMEAIRNLSDDPCAGVRSAVVTNLVPLSRSAADTFWAILKRAEGQESNRRVIELLLATARRVAGPCPEEVLALAQTVFTRFRDDRQASKIRCACLTASSAASVSEGDPFHDELVPIVLGDVNCYTDEALHLIRLVAQELTRGPVEPTDPQTDRLRMACFQLLDQIGQVVQRGTLELNSRVLGVNTADLPPEIAQQARTLRKIAHELSQRTYFASGSFDDKRERMDPRRGEFTEAVKRRFFRESNALLRLLAGLGFADVAHSVLETLVGYIALEPRSVFLLIGEVVRYGEAGGYQLDDLAANLVVRLVRQYLADYRLLFRQDAECRRALLDVLNTFVRAGWPQALELTLRLEEIYR